MFTGGDVTFYPPAVLTSCLGGKGVCHSDQHPFLHSTADVRVPQALLGQWELGKSGWHKATAFLSGASVWVLEHYAA